MKLFTNKENSKKIVIIILLIMSFNFMTPRISQADFGGKLFKPIAQLLRGLGDLTMQALQLFFIGDGTIEVGTKSHSAEKLKSSYNIYYSPGLIFANRVGLGVNFINPDEDEYPEIIVKNSEETAEELGRTDFLTMTSIDTIEDDLKKSLDAIKNETNVIERVFLDLGYLAVSSEDQKTIDNAFKINYEKDGKIVKTCDGGWTEDFKVNGKNYRIFYDTVDLVVFNKDSGETLFEETVYNGGEYGTKQEVFKILIKKAKTELESEVAYLQVPQEEYNKKKDEFLQVLEACLTEVWYGRAKADSGYDIVKKNFEFEGIKFSIHEQRGYTPDEQYLSIKKTVGVGEVELKRLEVKSISRELQPIIATWYKALRAIALVGLLSVLVYVGIRILLSSTSQEKAKYKKMIIDWVVALCLLFVLQYIMAFTLDIANKITEMLAVNIVGEQGQDLLMSNVRDGVGDGEKFSEIFADILIYLVLVIFTVTFTIQYLKRLLYMAFFTMIAPLVTLTYPLDKIKDGKAQAFTIWLREYIFNSLLQPMHLLLYTIFVSSASNLVEKNWIYAIVAIGFMVPAEKFFRKMFGFEQASSASPMGAAAGGAFVMNAINKMGQRAGKHASGGKGGAEGSEGSGGKTAPRYVPSPNGSNSQTNGSPQIGPQPYNGQQLGGYALGQTINPAGAAGARSFRNGARTLKGHYFNKANGKKLAKGAGRIARKGIIGAAGAATLGTVGLAAGIATGDAGNAFKYGLAGAGVGYAGANNLGDKAVAFEKKNREIFKEGALGTDEYNTRNSIKELTNDNDFNNVCNHLGVTDKAEKEQLIRQFHSNGITSASDIKKAMNAGASANNKNRDQIIAAAKIRKQATQYGMKRKDIEEMIKNNQPNISKADLKNAMDLIDML